VPKQLPDRFSDLGAFIRDQRNTARLSLRRLSELAGISNPYLSQIERGLRRPSAEILQQIAKALRISAETLYVQAGILEPGSADTDLSREMLADPYLTEDQKQALIRIYLSFRHENEGARDGADRAEQDRTGQDRAEQDRAGERDDAAGGGAGSGGAGDQSGSNRASATRAGRRGPGRKEAKAAG